METSLTSEDDEKHSSSSELFAEESYVERTLSTAEHVMLEHQNLRLVAPSRQLRIEKEASKSWDIFYKRNEKRFYKDRHWTTREFPELISESLNRLTILEVGCGVGNFMFPILADQQNIFFYACDFSQRAVDFIKANPQYSSERCHAFCADVTTQSFSGYLPPNTVNYATLIFVLSAIHPDKMLAALQNIFTVLAPGGSLLFRDYGINDYAMLRFSCGSKIADRFYVRQDNTCAYYFSLEELGDLMMRAGFTTTDNKYVLRETVNRQEGLCVRRVFIQGKFRKPVSSEGELLPEMNKSCAKAASLSS